MNQGSQARRVGTLWLAGTPDNVKNQSSNRNEEAEDAPPVGPLLTISGGSGRRRTCGGECGKRNTTIRVNYRVNINLGTTVLAELELSSIVLRRHSTLIIDYNQYSLSKIFSVEIAR